MVTALIHQSVMLDEAVALLAVQEAGVYIDGTVGAGGHSAAIAGRLGGAGRLLALDCDREALVRASRRLDGAGKKIIFCQSNYAAITDVAAQHGIKDVDGILLDLGISSDQLAAGERGFSFNSDGPLDMRLDKDGGGLTAADLVNTTDEEVLAGYLWEYGEERESRRIARAIVEARRHKEFRTTGELAAVVGRVKRVRGKIHPATQTFQALRIVVNDELGNLAAGLVGALALLRPGGRLVVISFHSLEDRLVKRFFLEHQGRWESLAEGGQRWLGSEPRVRILTRKPLVATAEEIGDNPRARSAKLRAAERIGI